MSEPVVPLRHEWEIRFACVQDVRQSRLLPFSTPSAGFSLSFLVPSLYICWCWEAICPSDNHKAEERVYLMEMDIRQE
jgi:hypothetical protein